MPHLGLLTNRNMMQINKILYKKRLKILIKTSYIIDLVKKTDFDTKVTETENEIPNFPGSVTNTTFNTKVTKNEKKPLILLV